MSQSGGFGYVRAVRPLVIARQERRNALLSGPVDAATRNSKTGNLVRAPDFFHIGGTEQLSCSGVQQLGC
jgi:hypothetical protein